MTRLSVALTFAVVTSVIVHADDKLPTRDITFASPDGHDLKLDLFLPDDVENPPLVVFVHGGGWKPESCLRSGVV